MDDIAAQLSQILSDPAQMAQISQLASSLGLGQQDTPEPETAPAGDLGFDMGALTRLLPLLKQSGGRETQILQALRPYLSAADQARVDRALRAAKLSRLTRLALQELGDSRPGGLL